MLFRSDVMAGEDRGDRLELDRRGCGIAAFFKGTKEGFGESEGGK